MKDIKKLMITLVALLAVTTGAWADQLASSYSSNATLNAVTVSASMEVTIATGVTVTINNGLNITSGTLTVKGPGTLVVNGKAGSNGGRGYTGGNGTPGSAAITGNIKVMDNATIQANGGAGGNGGRGDSDNGGNGANGAAAISGNVTVLGGATVKATGGNGGNGGDSGLETGGNGAQGGAAITGEVTIQDASTLEATGGNGGNGGWGEEKGGNGGNGANAIGGTLNYKGGTVTADGGNGGSGGGSEGGIDGPSGSAGKAFATSVNFVSSDYILTDGSNAITATQVTSKKKVVISPKVAVNSVTLAQTAASMTVGGETLTLTATVAPTNATDPTVKWNVTAGADKVKLYKDENCSTEVGTAATDVLTVYAKGLAVGEATVTVTSNDDATKTAACTMTVIPSGPEVAWNKAKKTGTFTMPGGNVTLEPEYYPQAALTAQPTAINDVPATTDGAIVNAGTVANIGETTTAQGTVMYYVSPTALDDAALLALAADQWTADVPTAESLAEGQAYIYYYVRGNDSDNDEENFSDGDILAANALTVTIAAEPTYAVTFAEGVNPEPPAEPEWTASPNADVKKGTEVTVTYTGTKKVIGVKAEKKAAESLIVNPVVGQVIGSDGKNYDADATLPDGVTKVAMIAYVGNDAETSTTYNHGLALALEDVSSTTMNWCSQADATCLGTQYDNSTKFNDLAGIANTDALVNHTGHTHAAASAARNYNSGTHPAGTSAWFLPSAGQWNKMFTAAGGYANLKTNASLNEEENYWSSTECSGGVAWDFDASDGSWHSNSKTYVDLVRACLAF